VEHEDNANTMGQLAGRNMAGEREAYHHLRFFYSDLFEFSYATARELDSGLEIVTDLTEQNPLGAIHYLPTESGSRGALGTSGAR
jgi:3-phenylpropionate/trans-cinnamate dioxygenase ferredoxin reductase component